MLETKSLSGVFTPISGPDGQMIDPTSISRKGKKEQKQLVDEDELPEEYKEAIEAEHFIIYGKASVEQYDDDTPSQKIKMDALEDALPQLFKSGLISRRHKDVRVGEVLKTYELDSSQKFEVGDEVHEFDEGDVISTHAEDDELWIIADIWNDTEIAKDTRLRSLAGDLNGFSVTIYAKETKSTAKGEEVTDVDWHAVTIGSDDQIKNKESRFGVAEFKLFDDPVRGLGEKAARMMRTSMFDNLLRKSADEADLNGELLQATSQVAEKAQETDQDVEDIAADVTEDTDVKADDVVEAVGILGDNASFKAGGDMEEILQAVEEGELSTEEALQMMESEDEAEDEDGEEMKEETEDEDEEEQKAGDDEEEEEEEKSFEEKLDEHGVVTEEKLDEKLDEVQSDVEQTIDKAFDEAVPNADEIAEKMETGSTESPSSGTGSDQKDYTDEITSKLGGGE